jgi:hypothetical protein
MWNALLCALPRPRHRYRRRPTLSYHQRVLRLTSCVRSRPQRESRGYRNKYKYKSSIRRRRSRRKRGPSFNIRHRLKEKLGEDFLHQVSCRNLYYPLTLWNTSRGSHPVLGSLLAASHYIKNQFYFKCPTLVSFQLTPQDQTSRKSPRIANVTTTRTFPLSLIREPHGL